VASALPCTRCLAQDAVDGVPFPALPSTTLDAFLRGLLAHSARVWCAPSGRGSATTAASRDAVLAAAKGVVLARRRRGDAVSIRAFNALLELLARAASVTGASHKAVPPPAAPGTAVDDAADAAIAAAALMPRGDPTPAHVYVSRVKDAIANFGGVVEAVPELSAVDDEGGDDGDGGPAGSDSSDERPRRVGGSRYSVDLRTTVEAVPSTNCRWASRAWPHCVHIADCNRVCVCVCVCACVCVCVACAAAAAATQPRLQVCAAHFRGHRAKWRET
jgi:hypothetical protein